MRSVVVVCQYLLLGSCGFLVLDQTVQAITPPENILIDVVPLRGTLASDGGPFETGLPFPGDGQNFYRLGFDKVRSIGSLSVERWNASYPIFYKMFLLRKPIQDMLGKVENYNKLSDDGFAKQLQEDLRTVETELALNQDTLARVDLSDEETSRLIKMLPPGTIEGVSLLQSEGMRRFMSQPVACWFNRFLLRLRNRNPSNPLPDSEKLKILQSLVKAIANPQDVDKSIVVYRTVVSLPPIIHRMKYANYLDYTHSRVWARVLSGAVSVMAIVSVLSEAPKPEYRPLIGSGLSGLGALAALVGPKKERMQKYVDSFRRNQRVITDGPAGASVGNSESEGSEGEIYRSGDYIARRRMLLVTSLLPDQDKDEFAALLRSSQYSWEKNPSVILNVGMAGLLAAVPGAEALAISLGGVTSFFQFSSALGTLKILGENRLALNATNESLKAELVRLASEKIQPKIQGAVEPVRVPVSRGDSSRWVNIGGAYRVDNSEKWKEIAGVRYGYIEVPQKDGQPEGVYFLPNAEDFHAGWNVEISNSADFATYLLAQFSQVEVVNMASRPVPYRVNEERNFVALQVPQYSKLMSHPSHSIERLVRLKLSDSKEIIFKVVFYAAN